MSRPRFVPLALTLAWLAIAGPVAADCEMAPPLPDALDEAPVAFVGSVAALRGPAATFTISEVWAGELGPVVEVRGLSERSVGRSTEGEQSFVEDDRTWVLGETYLVVPIVDGSVLRDSICTATTEWTDELAAHRPSEAVVVTTIPSSPMPTLVVVVAAIALALIVLGDAAFRRRAPKSGG